jgi:uncharacterized protein (TIGR03790 family)
MAEWWIACRDRQVLCRALQTAVLGLALVSPWAVSATQPPQGGSTGGVTPAATAAAAAASAAPAASAAFAASAPVPAWIRVPRVVGRLHAADLGLVINTADPYSVQVGEHYIAARHLAPAQVLRLALPVKPVLSHHEFERLRDAIAEHFGPATQALALAWTAPFAVECNAITGALALGFDGELCKRSCDKSSVSRYFNSPSARPLADHGLRPSMLLAAPSVDQAKALIDRGVAADGQLALRGRPPVSAMLLATNDAARSVRMRLYPPPGFLRAAGVELRVEPAAELARAPRVLLALTGSVHPDLTPPPDWVPGGLGDHLTSLAGRLSSDHNQGTVLDWIASGATASHGPVSEPCNHLQKFPHPQVLLLHYLQGSTAIEAYWKSVAWPQQSLFVGEPLAAPFARR